MTLHELIERCRLACRDNVPEYLHSDESWRLWLSEAEREACERAGLIVEDSSVAARMPVVAGQCCYELDQSVLDILAVRVDERSVHGWEATDSHLILPRAFKPPKEIVMTIRRAPLELLMLDSGPEIAARYHLDLVDWALACALRVRDADHFNLQDASFYEARFERKFGAKKTVAVRVKNRIQRPRRVTAIDF